jgi:hypothetical protein
MELIKMLTDQLGVSEDQAKGGAGLLVKLAKDKLSGDEFSEITNSIPGLDGLTSSAPKSGGIAGALGGLASSFGGGAGSLGNIASLAGGFKKLGLNADMVSKFIPIVLSFAQSKGGDTAKNLLSKVLK